MSILSLLLLFFIIYLCAKAVGSIWRDAFGTIDGSSTRQRQQRRTYQEPQTPRGDQTEEKPIKKGEGEYVDYEEIGN